MFSLAPRAPGWKHGLVREVALWYKTQTPPPHSQGPAEATRTKSCHPGAPSELSVGTSQAEGGSGLPLPLHPLA